MNSTTKLFVRTVSSSISNNTKTQSTEERSMPNGKGMEKVSSSTIPEEFMKVNGPMINVR